MVGQCSFSMAVGVIPRPLIDIGTRGQLIPVALAQLPGFRKCGSPAAQRPQWPLFIRNTGPLGPPAPPLSKVNRPGSCFYPLTAKAHRRLVVSIFQFHHHAPDLHTLTSIAVLYGRVSNVWRLMVAILFGPSVDPHNSSQPLRRPVGPDRDALHHRDQFFPTFGIISFPRAQQLQYVLYPPATTNQTVKQPASSLLYTRT